LTVAGVQDILTKQLGSNNPHNVVKATMVGIKQLWTAERMAAKRGLSVPRMYGLSGKKRVAMQDIGSKGAEDTNPVAAQE
jgi:small subunit ribosomal protein S5